MSTIFGMFAVDCYLVLMYDIKSGFVLHMIAKTLLVRTSLKLSKDAKTSLVSMELKFSGSAAC